jgi:hypothetical protein
MKTGEMNLVRMHTSNLASKIHLSIFVIGFLIFSDGVYLLNLNRGPQRRDQPKELWFLQLSRGFDNLFSIAK